MPESTLSLGLSDLAEEVAFLLGYDRVAPFWSGWNPSQPYVPLSRSSQLGDIMACIRQGLRRFYTPSGDGTMPPHRWSFLTPERTITTAVGVIDYALPDDFGGFEGQMTYPSTANRGVTLKRVGIGEVRRRLQLSPGLTTAPEMFAENPLPSDGVQGQRYQVSFYPAPDQVYVLTYRCNVLASQLTVANPYPYGGEQHGDTIMAACLAAAEVHLGNEHGPMSQLFKERLTASIAADARNHRPEYMGQNLDRSDGLHARGYGLYGSDHTWLNTVQYGGNSIG